MRVYNLTFKEITNTVTTSAMMDQAKNVHCSEREKLLLAQLITEESAIDCKKTGAMDLKQKAEAWERVTKKFISEGCTPRTSKQLQKCWDNLKQKKRKLTTTMKHQRLMTGGGPAAVERVDPVMDFIDETSGNIDVEIDCPFDSTAGFERDYDMGFLKESLTVQNEDKDIYSETVVSHLGNQSHRQVSPYVASSSKKKGTSSHENLEDWDEDIYSNTILSHPRNQNRKQVSRQLASSSTKKGTSSHENLEDRDEDIYSNTILSHPRNQNRKQVSRQLASSSTKKGTSSHENLEDRDEDIYSDTILSHPRNQNRKQVSSQLASSSTKKGTANRENLENISDERVLRLIRLREAIEQQRELHAKKMKIAEAEEKIAILNILKLEEQLK